MDSKNKMKDFLASVILLLLSVFILFESYHIYTASGKPLYLSPSLIPFMLGGMLLVLSLLLMTTSLKDGGLKARKNEMAELFGELKADPNTMRMLTGVLIMALYTFVLLGLLPFWLATFAFMVLLMKFLNAGSLVKIALISAGITAIVVVLFEVCFRVPLP